MECPICGKEMPEDREVCEQCEAGATVAFDAISSQITEPFTPVPFDTETEAEAEPTPAFEPADITRLAPPIDEPAPDEAFEPHSTAELKQEAAGVHVDEPSPAQDSKAGRGKRIALIVAIVVVVGALCAFGGYQCASSNERQLEEQEYQEQHSQHAVKLSITAVGYSSATATRIPVHVTGTTIYEQDVDEVQFVNENGEGLELPQGDYKLAFPAAVVSIEGSVWSAPGTVLSFSITSDIEMGESYDDLAGKNIMFTPLDAASVTDTMLETTRTYAVQDADATVNVDECIAAAQAARDAAVAAAQLEAATTARQQKHDEFNSRYTEIKTKRSTDWNAATTLKEQKTAITDALNSYESLAKDIDYWFESNGTDDDKTSAASLKQQLQTLIAQAEEEEGVDDSSSDTTSQLTATVTLRLREANIYESYIDALLALF